MSPLWTIVLQLVEDLYPATLRSIHSWSGQCIHEILSQTWNQFLKNIKQYEPKCMKVFIAIGLGWHSIFSQIFSHAKKTKNMYFWLFEKDSNRISSHKCFEIWYFIAKNCLGELSTYQIWTSLASSQYREMLKKTWFDSS